MEPEKFGEWLFIARARKKMRQKQLGAIVNCTKSHISALETAARHSTSGRPRVPPAELIDKLADALEANADEGRHLMGYAPRPVASLPALDEAAEGAEGETRVAEAQATQALVNTQRHLNQVQRQLDDIARSLEHVRRLLPGSSLMARAGESTPEAESETVGATGADPEAAMPETSASRRASSTTHLLPSSLHSQAQSGGSVVPLVSALGILSVASVERVFAVANPVADVGKTFVSLALATCLAERGRTLLIDATPNASLTRQNRLSRPSASLHDALTGRLEPAHLLQIAARRLATFELLMSGWDMLKPIDETQVAQPHAEQVAAALRGFQYIVIDTPSSSGYWLDLALRLGTDVVIPLANRPSPMESSLDAAWMVGWRAGELRGAEAPPLRVYGLLNRVEAGQDTQRMQIAAQGVRGLTLLQTEIGELAVRDTWLDYFDEVTEELLRRGE